MSAEDFEQSFCESVIYYWSKEYNKETTNVIAQALSANLELDYDSIEAADAAKLLARIVRRLSVEAKIGRSIVDFDDRDELSYR